MFEGRAEGAQGYGRLPQGVEYEPLISSVPRDRGEVLKRVTP